MLLPVVEVALILIALLITVPLVVLIFRRRWLARHGGLFECSVKLRPGRDNWALGVARYSGEDLEWFRVFSFSFAPQVVFRRGRTSVIAVRDPDAEEKTMLYDGQRILRLDPVEPPTVGPVDLAMAAESVTGLMSWLEAAPPGLRQRGT
ncbi:hypothetical protein GGQ54_000264 [Naumannella cuiyingiana]|uniref:DUF2550 family protein n=1 Tax=Naumannella cuiyingiana TaxID=1347891 RepID=A0A7Z0D6D8_9ACTN|nr:DUF2550 domain-containing protein [Naumannella cuiyingiana]NYI69704.1 hypothetical protein [Naumannella cuiyingiana]